MSNDSDFVALYHQLEIDPLSTLDEFKRAYRRRVSQLHPDRQPSNNDGPELQSLNALYSAALQFHRQYGRLPGAPLAPGFRPRPTHNIPRERAETSNLPTRRYALVAFVALSILGLLVFSSLEETSEHAAEVLFMPQKQSAVANAPEQPPGNRQIRLGSSRADVARIQGAPLSQSDEFWEFGPSWISFECGLVRDWYSSPLRPLRVATARPEDTQSQALKHEFAQCRARSALRPASSRVDSHKDLSV